MSSCSLDLICAHISSFQTPGRHVFRKQNHLLESPKKYLLFLNSASLAKGECLADRGIKGVILIPAWRGSGQALSLRELLGQIKTWQLHRALCNPLRGLAISGMKEMGSRTSSVSAPFSAALSRGPGGVVGPGANPSKAGPPRLQRTERRGWRSLYSFPRCVFLDCNDCGHVNHIQSLTFYACLFDFQNISACMDHVGIIPPNPHNFHRWEGRRRPSRSTG